MNSTFKKVIGYALKASIFILVIWYCIRLIKNSDSLIDFKNTIRELDSASIVILLLVIFFLMLLNWFVESLKWQYLCRKFQIISRIKALESVFCGLAWAVFTPNRIGEYGGRVLFLKPRKRVFGLIGMTVGAVSQMVITNVLGIVAMCWFLNKYLQLDPFLYLLICLLGFILIAFFLLLYFRISVINSLLLKIGFLKKYKRFFDLLLRYEHRDLRRVFMYSLLRYVIFTAQYCILIWVLIPEFRIEEMILMVFILFFVQSALPSLDLFDVGVRSVTAAYFFGFVTSEIVSIMAIVACIWFMNLILPAIIGSVLVFNINFFDTRNN